MKPLTVGEEIKSMKVTDFINGKVTYDNETQHFWIEDRKGCVQMLAQLRGWGHIQNMFNRPKFESADWMNAEAFQDEIGEWVAAAINEKLEREKK